MATITNNKLPRICSALPAPLCLHPLFYCLHRSLQQQLFHLFNFGNSSSSSAAGNWGVPCHTVLATRRGKDWAWESRSALRSRVLIAFENCSYAWLRLEEVASAAQDVRPVAAGVRPVSLLLFSCLLLFLLLLLLLLLWLRFVSSCLTATASATVQTLHKQKPNRSRLWQELLLRGHPVTPPIHDSLPLSPFPSSSLNYSWAIMLIAAMLEPRSRP